jgi:hypothetical protein
MKEIAPTFWEDKNEDPFDKIWTHQMIAFPQQT